MDKIRILFVRPFKSSFIQNDLKLLKNNFTVNAVDFAVSLKNLPDTLFGFYKLINGVLWADVTFSWFIDNHSFFSVLLSKWFHKKSIVVVGGYEVAKVPEIGYGALLNPIFARKVKFVLDNADKVLAVSEFNKKEILNVTSSKNVELVYNGVDCDGLINETKKDNLVVTVGNSTKRTCKLKGINTFVKASLAFPEIRFVIIGKYDEHIRQKLNKIAPNVEFTGAIPNEEVVILLQKAKVYCQLSYRESFGMALAESMCCECVPVVSFRGALPEIVGGAGYYIPYGNTEATVDTIKIALMSYKGKDARKRIIKNFTLERRGNELIELIKGM